jgi:hypothetical protein
LHDEPRYHGRPLKAILIASAPRSGSSLLVQGLVLSKAVPTTGELFNLVHMADFYHRWGQMNDAEYVTKLFGHRTNMQSIFQLSHISTTMNELRIFYRLKTVGLYSQNEKTKSLRLYPDFLR